MNQHTYNLDAVFSIYYVKAEMHVFSNVIKRLGRSRKDLSVNELCVAMEKSVDCERSLLLILRFSVHFQHQDIKVMYQGHSSRSPNRVRQVGH